MDNPISILSEKGLKITLQRKIILDAINNAGYHPDAESIIRTVKTEYPNISQGTVYKTLDLFCKKGIIRKLDTPEDKLRFDSVTEPHYHIFCTKSGKIKDYYDTELNNLLNNYFRQKKIRNFQINDIRVQITGTFNQLKQI
jgi:Fur family peroxide stress response transcriptional regulator